MAETRSRQGQNKQFLQKIPQKSLKSVQISILFHQSYRYLQEKDDKQQFSTIKNVKTQMTQRRFE